MSSASISPTHPKGSAQSGAWPKQAIFQIYRPDTSLFATLDGLTKQTGEPSDRLRCLMAKELCDNALDACDAAGKPGEVTIRKHGRDAYVVADKGNGISGSPDDLAALFSIHRPMVSSKFLRRPERGALGNGLRVIVGCVVVADGTIEVTTHGKRVMLRPRRMGPTAVISVTDAPDATGTTLTVTLGDAIPDDDADLLWAELAIFLAKHGKASSYARQPSPLWLDLDAFIEMLVAIEPATATVRQIVEQFDGCTGAKAGKLAAPFGKNRLARSMSDSDAAALLASMQATAREVKHKALSPIGPEAYDRDAFDYARASGTFAYGAHAPHAAIPYIVEVWVSAKSRKGRSVEIEHVFANRSPIVGDEIDGRRSDYFGGKYLHLNGCGLDDALPFDDFPLGDFTASLHIISPLIPLLSIGKRPNFLPFLPAIETAIRRAFKRSRDRLPLEIAEPKAPPPPKPPRPPTIEKPAKTPAVIYEPQGMLGQIIATKAEAAGVRVGDLLVMSRDRDPFALDTERGHIIGKWFAQQVKRHVAVGGVIHLRGLHYIIASHGDIVRPDTAELYVNDEECWRWLQEKAAKIARWLQYVEFDCIRDARNEDPLWYATDAGQISHDTSSDSARTVEVGYASLEAEVPELDELLPYLTINSGTRPVQPYRLGIIGEKSSLHPVVEPIAREYDIDVVLDTGDASDTHLYAMAERASRDPRPFLVFYLSDFDPSGFNMPTAVSRKFQALCHLCFPDIDLRLYPVALTREQVIEYDLPSTPLKATEKRAQEWQERMGLQQTELDALMALRPGALEAILTAAVKPYYDATLARRFDEAMAMPDEANAWFKALPAYTHAVEAITPLQEAAVEAAEALNDAVQAQAAAVRKAVRQAEDAPKFDPIEITAETTIELPEPLFHSRDDFVTATRKLIARKSLAADDADTS